MKESPLKGDWIHLINQDMVKFGMDMSDESTPLLSKKDFQKIVKTNMRKTVEYKTRSFTGGGHSTLWSEISSMIPIKYFVQQQTNQTSL